MKTQDQETPGAPSADTGKGQAEHTRGARRVAELLVPGINGKGRAATIPTEWGRKTREGVADMIDNETGLPDLLKTLRDILADAETANDKRTAPDWDFACYHIAAAARAAIQQVEGRGE